MYGQVLLDDPNRIGGSSQLLIGVQTGDGTGSPARSGGAALKTSLSDQNLMNTRMFTGLLPMVLGSFNVATYPGVILGVLADSAARIANGTALQAALDFCATNGLSAFFPPGRYEYIVNRVQSGVNVGLQALAGVNGVFGAGQIFTKLIQFGQNCPALTIGEVGISAAGKFNGDFDGFSVGYGTTQLAATQTGTTNGTNVVTGIGSTAALIAGIQITGTGIPSNTTIASVDSPTQVTMSASATASGTVALLFAFNQSAKLLLGQISRSTIAKTGISADNNISGSTINGYYALRVGLSTTDTFYSNTVGNVNLHGGQDNIIRSSAGTTGNDWRSIYLGGGAVGNRIVLGSGSGAYAPNGEAFFHESSTQPFGTIQLINSEWLETPTLLFSNDAIDMGHFYTEGCKLVGANPNVCRVASGSLTIRQFRLLNLWVDSAFASGNPRFFFTFGNTKISVREMKLVWNGGSEQVQTMNMRLYDNTGSSAGTRVCCEIENYDASGNAGAIDLSPTYTAATYGGTSSLGTSAFQQFLYDDDFPTTFRATRRLPSGNGTVTVYGCDRSMQVELGTPLTADRSLILSAFMRASGQGSTTPRLPGDTMTFFRTSGATGAFNWLIYASDGTTLLYTIAAGAGLTKATWTGSAWA